MCESAHVETRKESIGRLFALASLKTEANPGKLAAPHIFHILDCLISQGTEKASAVLEAV